MEKNAEQWSTVQDSAGQWRTMQNSDGQGRTVQDSAKWEGQCRKIQNNAREWMNKCRVLLGSGEQCKKRAAQDSANLQHSRKLNMFNNCQLIRPTKTALQCLIDQNYSIVVTALTYRIQQAKKLLMKYLVSTERNSMNLVCIWNPCLGCLLLAVLCLLPQLCCQVAK
jgi:hypothetical protein